MMARSVVATIAGLGGELPEFEPVVTADERADVREALEEIKPYWKGRLLGAAPSVAALRLAGSSRSRLKSRAVSSETL